MVGLREDVALMLLLMFLMIESKLGHSRVGLGDWLEEGEITGCGLPIWNQK